MERLRGYEQRIERYGVLLQETSRGGLVERPRLWALSVKGGGPRIVRVLSRVNGLVCFETLAGGRSSLKESEIEALEPLEESSARAEIRNELARLAAAGGVEVSGEPGRPLSYREGAGRTVQGMKFFDLADFCARNGFNEEIVALFDEGLRRDPDLPRTVREARAGRLVDAYLYFRVMRASGDARRTLAILEDRYADTEAYKKRVLKDREEELVVPPPVRVPPQVLPAKAGEWVARGNRYFNEAMEHLRRSDPNENPSGWAAENEKALELLLKANGEGYLPAQEMFAKGAVPKLLLDRVRETQKLVYECRRRIERK
jgi:hypothetical protein